MRALLVALSCFAVSPLFGACYSDEHCDLKKEDGTCRSGCIEGGYRPVRETSDGSCLAERETVCRPKLKAGQSFIAKDLCFVSPEGGVYQVDVPAADTLLEMGFEECDAEEWMLVSSPSCERS